MRLKPPLFMIGGAAFLLGAVLLITAVLARPAVTATPIAAGQVFAWKLSLMAMYASAAFLIAGCLTLALHYAETRHAPWAVLGLAAVIPGTVGYLAGGAVEWTFLTTGYEHTAGAVVPGALWGVLAMASAGRILCWAGMAAQAVAVTADRRLPRWLGPAGIVLAAIEIIGELALSGAVLELLWLLGFAWVMVLGVLMMQRHAALAAAPAPEAELAHTA